MRNKARIRGHILLTVVVLMLCLAAGNSAIAATYYVSTAGNDSNTCSDATSATKPKQTISTALTCLAAGDTLLLRSGTFVEGPITFWTNHVASGTSDNPITIQAFPGESVVVQMPKGASGNLFDFYDISYITVKD